MHMAQNTSNISGTIPYKKPTQIASVFYMRSPKGTEKISSDASADRVYQK